MADLTADERNGEIEMLSTPTIWPNWPFLPMKRPGYPKHAGGSSVTADYPTIVLKGFPAAKAILLQLACEDGVPIPGSDELWHADPRARAVYEAAIVARYDDLDGLLDAGWRID